MIVYFVSLSDKNYICAMTKEHRKCPYTGPKFVSRIHVCLHHTTFSSTNTAHTVELFYLLFVQFQLFIIRLWWPLVLLHISSVLSLNVLKLILSLKHRVVCGDKVETPLGQLIGIVSLVTEKNPNLLA